MTLKYGKIVQTRPFMYGCISRSRYSAYTATSQKDFCFIQDQNAFRFAPENTIHNVVQMARHMEILV